MRIKNQMLLLLIIIFLSSCKKNEYQSTPLASLKVVNAVTDGAMLRLNGVNADIYNKGYSMFSILTGHPDIYVWPIDDSLNPYYSNVNKQTAVAPNEIFTLFLSGEPGNIDALWVKENLPYRGDSTIGIRFINLASNSVPVNVTLSGNLSENEFENIDYQGITDFKTFSANTAAPDLMFEVRSAADPDLIIATSYIPATFLRFKNITLVLNGNIGGATAPEVMMMLHY
ncbi:MAG: DUF4397 domain-containing protein [Chitinophagaceae bacterium]|nr:DUF4397 domain-containing protein [Chitinophagaceae bacterium]